MGNENSIAHSYYVLPQPSDLFYSRDSADSADRSNPPAGRHSHLLCGVQELEKEGREGRGKGRLNLIVKFDRAEFPAPNIYSQSPLSLRCLVFMVRSRNVET